MKKQLLLSLALFTPLFYLLYELFVAGAEDPIDTIYALTGATALTLLFATMSLSMLRRAFNLMRYRRTVGLFSFFYALLHLLNFIVFDMELNLGTALHETVDKPFIYLGMSAFSILLFMALTSTRSLFAKYHRYHKGIYLAITLASVHFVMAQKALSLTQWGLLALMGVIGVSKLLQHIRVPDTTRS